MINRKVHALVLFSGGLDSCLAYKILEKQGIKVEAVIFTSFFFDEKESIKIAERNGFKCKVKDISSSHFEIVKKPKFGYGGAMNPCIDCHALMLKEAGKIVKEEGFDFIVTGEVLGQRPMSQNKEALKKIEKESGMVGKILRPLSALKLPETEIEKLELVEREKLLGIIGRSRKEQIKLAKNWGVKHFSSPGGGCVLTEKEYSKKLKKLLQRKKKIKGQDINLLKMGRHFWEKNNWLIVGKNKKDNKILEKAAEKGDVLVELSNIPGPLVLIKGKQTSGNIDKAKELVIKYLSDSRKKEINKKEFKIKKI